MKHRSSSQFIKNFFLTFFIIGFLFFSSSCVKQSRVYQNAITQRESQIKNKGKQININTATRKELEVLPAIGEEMAARIIAHREHYGPFRRVENLILIRGMSDSKFRKLREFIIVDAE